MKTPFETLLRLRSQSLSRSQCPYTDEQLALFVSRVVDESTPSGLFSQHSARRLRPWPIVRAACLAVFLFSAAYYLTPAQPNAPFSTTGSLSSVEAYSTINHIVSYR